MAVYLVMKFCMPIMFIFPLREYVGWIKAMCSVQTDFYFLFFRSIKSSFIGITLHGGSGRCSAGWWAACGSMDLVVLPLGFFLKIAFIDLKHICPAVVKNIVYMRVLSESMRTIQLIWCTFDTWVYGCSMTDVIVFRFGSVLRSLASSHIFTVTYTGLL